LRCVAALAAWVCVSAAAEPIDAFYNLKVGERVENAALPTLDGKKGTLLVEGKATVFVFFRGEQETSELALGQIAALHKKLEDRAVHWVGIISDDYGTEDVRALVKRAGLRMPVLIDKGNVLYGRIGVVLHPTVGVTDAKHALTAYEPYRRINYSAVIEARLLRSLGEINDADVDKVLNPPKIPLGGDQQKAARNLKMAEMLYKAKKYDKAVKIAKRSVELAPDLAAAHGLIAASHAATGKCRTAQAAVKKALALDPGDPRALEAHKKCGR